MDLKNYRTCNHEWEKFNIPTETTGKVLEGRWCKNCKYTEERYDCVFCKNTWGIRVNVKNANDYELICTKCGKSGYSAAIVSTNSTIE